MENYIITSNTLAIISLGDKCEIIEKYQTFFIECNSYDLIAANCLYNKSSIEGRVEYSRYNLGSKHKCPILIKENEEIIMFPTTAYQHPNCIWFNYKGIKEYISNDNMVVVTLINNKKVTVKISAYSFSNQIFRSSRLESILHHQNR